MTAWARVFDRVNTDPKVRVAAAAAHVVPVVLFVLFFFSFNFEAKDDDSWIIVGLSPELMLCSFTIVSLRSSTALWASCVSPGL